jgi:hypothetical protein
MYATQITDRLHCMVITDIDDDDNDDDRAFNDDET